MFAKGAKTRGHRHPSVLVRIIEHGADGVFAAVKHGEADFGINYIGMQAPRWISRRR